MPDPFFQRKRKRSTGEGEKPQSNGRSRAGAAASSSSSRRGTERPQRGGRAGRGAREDSASSDDDSDLGGAFDDGDTRHRYDEEATADEERDADETPAEARVRMAKMYLEGLKSGEAADEDGLDAAAMDAENIAGRLQKDVSESLGKMHTFVAARLAPPSDSHSLLLAGGHRGSMTAAVASSDGRWVYTAGKDGNVFRWRLIDGRIDVLLPRASKAANNHTRASTSIGIARGDDSDSEPEAADDNAVAESASAAATTTTSTQSRSSGASRRRARREAAAAAGKLNTLSKGKGPAHPAGSGHSGHRLHDVVALGQGEGHTDAIWSLALSSDGRFLVTGGPDKRIGVWSCGDPVANKATQSAAPSSQLPSWVKALVGHKDAISGLRFRSGTHELYSASLDRTVKLFDVDQLSYIETLFGHQESIVSLDALRSELAVSVGGRDRSARWWKIRDESQLVFRGGAKSKLRDVVEGGQLLDAAESQGRKIRGDRGGSLVEGSLDCVAMIDDSHFLTGGDSGAISLWSLGKKKPVFTRAATHGFDEPRKGDDGNDDGGDDALRPRWITSLACLPYADVFASGSWDGVIRLWSLDRQLRSFKPLASVRAPGFVNSLQLFQPPRSSLRSPCVRPEEYRFRVKATNEPDSPAANAEQRAHLDAAGARAPALGRKESVPPILIAALGQEPRMARWAKDKKVRSAALVLPLSFRAADAEQTKHT
ncbi:unnamed protein product [Parajaminaea phylloscopi]